MPPPIRGGGITNWFYGKSIQHHFNYSIALHLVFRQPLNHYRKAGIFRQTTRWVVSGNLSWWGLAQLDEEGQGFRLVYCGHRVWSTTSTVSSTVRDGSRKCVLYILNQQKDYVGNVQQTCTMYKYQQWRAKSLANRLRNTIVRNIYLFIYCLPEIINVTITCKQAWGRTVRLTL